MNDLYFAYGSNMSTHRLAARLGRARALGRAQLAHFELAWNKPGADGSGKANVRPRVGSATWGVLFALEPREWPLLDGFEPGYARESHIVRDEAGRERSAQLYRWRRDAPNRAPTTEYLALVVAGAREHGIPADEIARIESAAPPGGTDQGA
ncbi:MAG: gamma-glutamylcyclotransferase family protein [Myxococcota bacterium]|nr:gamma-glutamylcyclotransferase family protein [Myxococcota bacterium]